MSDREAQASELEISLQVGKKINCLFILASLIAPTTLKLEKSL